MSDAVGWRRVEWLKGAAGTLFYVVTVALFLAVRAGSFLYRPVRATDTVGYDDTARISVWSGDFYTASRAFSVPLLYKLFPGDHGRITVQLVVSILCWLTLTAVLSAAMTHPVARRTAFAAILVFAATTEIILWDALLLSESLALSLTALLLAALVWLVRRWTWPAVAATLAVALLWAFTRDANAYLVLLLGVTVLAATLRSGHRATTLAAGLGSCAIFAASVASADAGLRWYQPMRDVLLNRVEEDPQMRRYFEEQLGPRWRDADARSVYARYLLSHPGYTLGEPFFGSQTTPSSSSDNLASIIDPDFTIYDDDAGDRVLTLPRFLNAIIFPRGVTTVLLVCAAVGLLSVFVALWLGASAVWLLPAALLASTIPHGLVVYHLSGLEVDRHALGLAVGLRLALLLLLMLSLDVVLGTRRGRARRSPVPATGAARP